MSPYARARTTRIGADRQQALACGFNQVILEIVAFDDAVVPPGCIGVPDSAVLIREFWKLGGCFYVEHRARPFPLS